MDREIRKILDSKESKINLAKATPSTRGMSNGQKLFARRGNKPLGMYIKELGQLWWMYFTRNGDFFVDRNLYVRSNFFVRRNAVIDGTLNKLAISDISDAIDKKHTQGTDTTLGNMTSDINMNTHKMVYLSVPLASGDSIRRTTKITEASLEDAHDKKHAKNADTALGAQSENLDMNSHKIVSVTDPTSAQDAATKEYVDESAGADKVHDILYVDNFVKYGSNPILEGDAGKWDSYGMRDNWILCDRRGKLVKENGQYIMYYKARNAVDGDTGMGIAKSYDGFKFTKYSAKLISVDSSPQDLYFKPDGTKMYIMGATDDTIYQYTLSIAWDILTATYDTKLKNVNAQDALPCSVFFKPDGTKMYVLGRTNNSIFQYTLSTAWDVSTATYDTKFKNLNAEDTFAFNIFLRFDGVKMYALGRTNDTVYQYTLGTPWDISTAAYDTKNKDISSQDTEPRGIHFKPDGTIMYMTGVTNDNVFQYALSTAWDISTANYNSRYIDVSGEDDQNGGIFFKPDGTEMYLSGDEHDTVFQYALLTAWDILTATYYAGNPIYVGVLDGMTKRGDNDYIAIYREAAGIKKATSLDGINWTVTVSGWLLTPADFGVSNMAMCAFTWINDKWYMVFEGGTPWHIYMASSTDFNTWTVENGGNAIYSGTGGEWDSSEQANPRLLEIAPGKYVILYNGNASSNVWDLGIIYSTSLTSGWTNWANNPVLSRGAGGTWDDERIESWIMLLDDVDAAVLRMWYFGLPTSHSLADGKIGYATCIRK